MRRIRNTGVIYTGRVGVRMRPLRGPRSTRRVAKARIELFGGPLAGGKVWLSASDGLTTLPIGCKGQAGHYANGNWVAAEVMAARRAVLAELGMA